MLVWIFYAHLLYNSYRRQRLPRVLINKGVGDEYIDSPCLICNMSMEPVFVFFMMVELMTSEGIYTTPMTDREGDEIPENGAHPALLSRTRQGPLHSGDCLEFVSFRRMLQRALKSSQLQIDDGFPVAAGVQLRWLAVHVICIYRPEKKPFGAVRRFSIEAPKEGQEVRLHPDTLDTENRRARKYRRQINTWLKTYL